MFEGADIQRDYYRIRISPDTTIATGVNVPDVSSERVVQTEMIATHHPMPEDMEAYERVLGDAMAGDATLFAREDFVEQAWRIVDPVLKAGTPIHTYEPGSWGPEMANERISPPGGWQNPTPTKGQ